MWLGPLFEFGCILSIQGLSFSIPAVLVTNVSRYHYPVVGRIKTFSIKFNATWKLFVYCCNLSGGGALIVWFTTNGMCVKNNTIIYVSQASNSKRDCDVEVLPMLTYQRLNIMTSVRKERLRRMISIVACCHDAKLCAYAARDFRSQQYHPYAGNCLLLY